MSAAAEPRPAVPPAVPEVLPAGAGTRCLNCAADLPAAPPARFCPACGQETRVRAPTLMEFAQQLGGAYFSTEGALWRTLALLVARPGELTRRYLAGRRKHYVLPLRLYLTISVVVLLVLRLTAGDEAVRTKVQPQAAAVAAGTDSFQIINFGESGRGVGIEQGHFYCNSLPAWFCSRLARRFDTDRDGVRREFESLGPRILTNLGPGLFLLLPMAAVALHLLYLNRRWRYTEHLVFVLHLHAFWFLMLALALTGWPPLAAAVAVVLPVYTLLAMRRAYGGRWWALLLRALPLLIAYTVALTAVLVVLIFWSLLV